MTNKGEAVMSRISLPPGAKPFHRRFLRRPRLGGRGTFMPLVWPPARGFGHLVGLVFWLTAASAWGQDQLESAKSVSHKVDPSVVTIKVDNNSQGSGFVVDPAGVADLRDGYDILRLRLNQRYNEGPKQQNPPPAIDFPTAEFLKEKMEKGFRLWTDQTGRKYFFAKYIGKENNLVKLTNWDGTAYSIPLELFSEEDQRILKARK
jgi:hypothetical protein